MHARRRASQTPGGRPPLIADDAPVAVDTIDQKIA